MPASKLIKAILPCRDLDESRMSKASAMVSTVDKNLIMTVIPDAGIYTYIIQHAIQQAAEYVRSNKLTYCDRDQADLLAFISRNPCAPAGSLRGATAVRAAGTTPAPDDRGSEAGVRSAATSLSHEPAHAGQGAQRHLEAKESKGVKQTKNRRGGDKR